jgi:hypothetical protein
MSADRQANKHSLPHSSDANGYHMDVYSYREGQVEPEKYHLPINEKPSEVRSIESLRQRLGVEKGY